ncbi:hypothetical protein Q426_08155 [Streptococcus equi subsp. zooepidemicus CY]|nr:hypothetical protein Q426_08155 [Streptococcus equi subsp. zooepidemicus CY]
MGKKGENNLSCVWRGAAPTFLLFLYEYFIIRGLKKKKEKRAFGSCTIQQP